MNPTPHWAGLEIPQPPTVPMPDLNLDAMRQEWQARAEAFWEVFDSAAARRAPDAERIVAKC